MYKTQNYENYFIQYIKSNCINTITDESTADYDITLFIQLYCIQKIILSITNYRDNETKQK